MRLPHVSSQAKQMHRKQPCKDSQSPLLEKAGAGRDEGYPSAFARKGPGPPLSRVEIWCASGRGGVHPRGPPTQGLEAKRGELGSSPCTGPFYNQGGFLSALQAVPTFYGHRGFWNLL